MTTRITAATRAGLETAARENGHSLSQEIEIRLNKSLNKSVLSASGRRNQALGASVAMLAHRLEGMTGRTWREDRFTGHALYAAVEAMVLSFLPPDEGDQAIPPRLEALAARLPADQQGMYGQPLAFGRMLALNLVVEIDEAAKQQVEAERRRKVGAPPEMPNEWTYPVGILWPEARVVVWNLKRDLEASDVPSDEETP